MSALPDKSEQARPVLERGGELRRRHADVLLQPEDETGVDGARAGCHHQSLERREAHRRVDRHAPVDGRERCPGAEVAADGAELLDRASRELGDTPRDVPVREPVEPVAAEVPSLSPLGGQGIRVSSRGNARVERGVEAGDRRDPGQHPADELQCAERLRLVERCKVAERVQSPQHAVVDPHRPDELVAAVNDAVADRVDRAALFDRLTDGVLLGAAPRRREVLRHRHGVVVEDGQLQAARTGVDDEDAHVNDSLKLGRVSRR